MEADVTGDKGMTVGIFVTVEIETDGVPESLMEMEVELGEDEESVVGKIVEPVEMASREAA